MTLKKNTAVICEEKGNIESTDEHADYKIRKGGHGLDFKKYTQQIWLAGLGAFSRAEEEGTRLFESLVKVGEGLEHKTADIAEKTVGAVEEIRDNVTDKLSQATDTITRVEHMLSEAVTQATSRLGLQATKQNSDITQQIKDLNDKVDMLLKEIQLLKQEKGV